jgi:hypothetical protein
MSNFLAICTATTALSQLVASAIQGAVPGAAVSTLRPDSLGDATPQPRVNLFLYQVTWNGAYRNHDLPTRNSSGALVHKPLAALDLHYLLTFFGDDTQLEPQRLLGSVVTALHAHPQLTRDDIQQAVDAATQSDPDHFLARSDLAEQVEPVKFSPMALNLEELSKMWSVLFQVPYALSMAYQGSLVLLEADGLPQSALPVRALRTTSAPARLPSLTAVLPASLEFEVGALLTLKGRHLGGEDVQVLFGEVAAAPHAVAGDTLVVRLPAGLGAGVNQVQVAHSLRLADSAEPRSLIKSNPLTFNLAPRITSASPLTAARGESLTLTCEPALRPSQRAILRVGERELLSPRRPAESGSLSFLIPPDFPAGDYLLQLWVDGAASLLEVDSSGRYGGPRVRVL